MKLIQAYNVCDALSLGLLAIENEAICEQSRAGDVMVFPTPVMTSYYRPWQRVLFSAARDANPFFHLAEAMWMLAGRYDAAFLDQFVHDFGKRFAENGELMASYGYRWRLHFEDDQLAYIIHRLKKDPKDRRVVLSMWDGMFDLWDDTAKSHLERDQRKDIPCNTHAYFRITNDKWASKLQMTVCCRSNDMIWGLYGANAVHFSFLQEYMAGMLGVDMGTYYHLSNNCHAYCDVLQRISSKSGFPIHRGVDDNRYVGHELFEHVPLVNDPETFDVEIRFALSCADIEYKNKFFPDVLIPALKAHAAYKRGEDPYIFVKDIKARDWRVACQEWLSRRTSQRTRGEVVQLQDITRGHA